MPQSPIKAALRGISRDAATAARAPTDEDVPPELLIRIGFEMPGMMEMESDDMGALQLDEADEPLEF